MLFAIEWVWTLILDAFWVRVGAISRPNGLSEATSKASVIKYANQEGSDLICYLLPPIEIFSFGPQCERETGRASQADVTPYGVGGFSKLAWQSDIALDSYVLL